jgi:hypothetical protein
MLPPRISRLILSRSGRPRPALIAFLFLGAALAGAGRGGAEALPEDPVVPFRRLLKEEKGLRTK